jgi:hypothetical protein
MLPLHPEWHMDPQDSPWTILSSTHTNYLGLGRSRHPNFRQLIYVCVFHVLAADGDIGPRVGKGGGSSIAGRKVHASGNTSAEQSSDFGPLRSWLVWVVWAYMRILQLAMLLLVVFLVGESLYDTWKEDAQAWWNSLWR